MWRPLAAPATSTTALTTTGSTCLPISRRAASSPSGTVEQNADGSTELYFGLVAPAGKEHNWIETIPGKGWYPIPRLYSPLQPFFDRTWRPSEIEPHNAG
jgi:hypothetical protein